MVNKLFEKKEYWIKWGIIYSICFVLVCLFYRCYLEDIIPQSAVIKSNNDYEQVIHDLHDTDVLSQQFISSRNFDYITLDFANHDLILGGKLFITITNENGEIVNYTETDIAGIQKKIALQIDGGGLPNSTYTVTINNDNTQADGIGIYGYPVEEQLPGEFPAYNSNNEQKYAISIGINKYTLFFENIVKGIIIVMMSGLFLFIIINGYFEFAEKQFSVEIKFLFLSIPIAISMLIMLNNYAYDEPAHQAAAYHYSNVILGTAQYDAHKLVSARKADVKYQSEYDKYVCENEQIMAAWSRIQDFEWTTDETEMILWEDAYYLISGPAFFSYFPYIIVIVISRFLGLGSLLMWILCRVVGFAIYEIGCFFAIKKTPIAKGLFAFAAASPMAIYSATGITYDSTTIWVSFLLMALIFTWWKRALSLKEWFVLVILAVILSGCKGGIYLTILILLFAVSIKRWNLTIKKISIIVGLLISVSLLFLVLYGDKLKQLLYCNLDDSESWYAYGSGFAFVYPIRFIKMMINTVVVNWEMYLGQLFGYRTQWMNGTIPFFIVVIFIGLFWAITIYSDDEEYVSTQEKIFVFIVLLFEYIGMHIIMLHNTKVGLEYIFGVQGRYFVPLLPLIGIIFTNNSLSRIKNSERTLFASYYIAQIIYIVFFVGLYLTV